MLTKARINHPGIFIDTPWFKKTLRTSGDDLGLIYIRTQNKETMKSTGNLVMALAAGMLMYACGGGTTENTESSAEEGTTAEMTTEESGMSGTFSLDNAESKLMWEGNMLKVGGVSLYGHNGTLDFQKGMMTMDNGSITEGTFVVDMTTITPTDENYGEENPKEKLIGHLSSPDFFDVENYPTATFQIKGMEGNKIMGDMTIRGVTHAEAIEDVTIETMGDKVMAKGTLTLDRQKYNVAWSNPAEDKVLSDDLDLEFNIVASKDATM
jgi:polyisoprenoid-binding protein YceI